MGELLPRQNLAHSAAAGVLLDFALESVQPHAGILVIPAPRAILWIRTNV